MLSSLGGGGRGSFWADFLDVGVAGRGGGGSEASTLSSVEDVDILNAFWAFCGLSEPPATTENMHMQYMKMKRKTVKPHLSGHVWNYYYYDYNYIHV